MNVYYQRENTKKQTSFVHQTNLNNIKQLFEQFSGITLKKIRKKLFAFKHIALNLSTINNALKKIKITLKDASLEVDRRNAIAARKSYALKMET